MTMWKLRPQKCGFSPFTIGGTRMTGRLSDNCEQWPFWVSTWMSLGLGLEEESRAWKKERGDTPSALDPRGG